MVLWEKLCTVTDGKSIKNGLWEGCKQLSRVTKYNYTIVQKRKKYGRRSSGVLRTF